MRSSIIVALLITLATIVGCKQEGSPPAQNSMNSTEMQSMDKDKDKDKMQQPAAAEAPAAEAPAAEAPAAEAPAETAEAPASGGDAGAAK